MTYHVKPSNQFKKDLKTIQKRGYNLTLLTEVIQLLADGQKLPEKNRDSFSLGQLCRMPRMSYCSGIGF